MTEYDYYNDYLESLKETYGKLSPDATEMSGRLALETLLKEVAKTISKPRTITHEPASIDGAAPDYKIEHATTIIGYLENKRPDSNLDKVVKSEQIKRYQKLNKNIMLTNYHEWIWLEGDNLPRKVQLFKLDSLQNPRFRLDPEKVKQLHRILLSFLEAEPKPIGDVQEFAEALAVRTRLLNEFMQKSLEQQKGGRLHGLYQAFKEQLHPQLEIAEFADTYAQMLTYGLFLARLNDKSDTQITLRNAEDSIPRPFALMKELVSFLGELKKEEYKDIKREVEQILFIINHMDREAIASSLSFKFRSDRSLFKGKDAIEFDSFSSDPFIYFYENFLAAYDSKLRETRGVYYTPPPIVNFIIRSLNDILKDIFKIPTGFADDKKVTALDFACGTGTFMLEIFQQVLNSIGAESAEDGKAVTAIKKHLLKNIYGFEFLIAAYAIAHLKLWQYLTDKGYEFQEGDRLQILLNNTLENTKETQQNFLVPALSEEAKLGQATKEKNILVITGNPPYSGHSQNPHKVNGKLTWIGKLIEDYKTIDGHSINERNSKWLQDDYVKFIRFAQHKMQEVDEGVVGIITNHSFIFAPSFPGMRHSLMDTFDQIYIIDLHGNSRNREKTKDGGKDENVFDIQQGVAISFFIKKKGLKKGIFYCDILGIRQEKYKWMQKAKFSKLNWQELSPCESEYLFKPQDNKLKPEYDEGWSVPDIFKISSVAIVTARDNLTVKFTKDEMQETVSKFASMPSEKARQHFDLRQDSLDWKVAWAQKDIKEHGQDDEMFKPILYRLFDNRYTYYSGLGNGFHCAPRKKSMDNMLKDNLALITARQSPEGVFNQVMITDNLVDFNSINRRGGSYLCPLYFYTMKKNNGSKDINKSHDNLSLSENAKQENFASEFRNFINTKYNYKFSPEEIMAYIYAVLHSPAYRSRYQELLGRKHPRIPFCESKKEFRKLAKIGQDLIDLHLMNSSQPDINLWQGKGNFEIEKIEYNENAKRLYINKDKYLHPIPKEVWEFSIGGYHVLEKYLKDRKTQDITSEANHVERIVDIIQNTMKAMETLDSLTPQAFPHWHKQ